MTHHPNVKQRVQEILAYCVEFLVGGEAQSVLILPQADGSVMTSIHPDSDIMQGLLPSGGTVQIPIDSITNVFQSRYNVTANWGGNGHSGRWMDEEKIVEMTEKGMSEKISRISDQEGTTVYKKHESFESIKADHDSKKQAKEGS